MSEDVYTLLDRIICDGQARGLYDTDDSVSLAINSPAFVRQFGPNCGLFPLRLDKRLAPDQWRWTREKYVA